MSVVCECPGLTLTVEREGKSFTVTLTRDEVCNVASIKDIAMTITRKIMEAYYMWTVKRRRDERRTPCTDMCKTLIAVYDPKALGLCVDLCIAMRFKDLCEIRCRVFVGLFYELCKERCWRVIRARMFRLLYREDEPYTFQFIRDHPDAIRTDRPETIEVTEELIMAGRFASEMYPYIVKWIIEAVIYTSPEEIDMLVEKCRAKPPSHREPILWLK